MAFLTTRDPFSLLDQWQREISQLAALTHKDDTSRVEGSNWTPAVDIKEEDDRFVLHADIPGVSADEIDVSMDKNVLTIKGERKHESTESGEGYKRIERSHGVFIRRFALPESIKADQISASSKDGVLEVVLPKQEPQHPRRIAVNGS